MANYALCLSSAGKPYMRRELSKYMRKKISERMKARRRNTVYPEVDATTSQDDIILKFTVAQGDIKRTTKEVTGEELKNYKRERGKKHPIDIVGSTKNFKIGYEIFSDSNLPPVSNILQKINIRRKNNKDITHWVAVLPYKKIVEDDSTYGPALRVEKIYTIGWERQDNNSIYFWSTKSVWPY